MLVLICSNFKTVSYICQYFLQVRMKKFLFILTFAILSLNVSAKISTISGRAPSYSGSKLELRSYVDQISNVERVMASAEVDSLGNFSFVVDLSSTMQLFIAEELFRGFLFVEPGKNYEIRLPQKEHRTLSQKLDPYFSPVEILLEIVGLEQTDLNAQLMQFEDAFDFYTLKHIRYGTKLDSIRASIDQMKEIFPDLYENAYSARFMEYRFLMLQNMSAESRQDTLIHQLNRLGVEQHNPAFWDLFNSLFADFIKQSSGDREAYLTFQRVVEEGNVKIYFLTIARRYGITDPVLKELVAIKWMYDLLNQHEFDQFKVYDFMQKIGAGISDLQNRESLTFALNNSQGNLIGMQVPDFKATNASGKSCNLKDYFGKFVYLNFCNSMLNQTQKDLEVMLRFKNDYKGDLEIINIGLYDEPEQMKKLSHRFGDKMEFWSVENPDELKKLFNIKSIPSYFLVDKDGNFLMTKGAEPNDELRMLLQRILKI